MATRKHEWEWKIHLISPAVTPSNPGEVRNGKAWRTLLISCNGNKGSGEESRGWIILFRIVVCNIESNKQSFCLSTAFKIVVAESRRHVKTPESVKTGERSRGERSFLKASLYLIQKNCYFCRITLKLSPWEKLSLFYFRLILSKKWIILFLEKVPHYPITSLKAST